MDHKSSWRGLGALPVITDNEILTLIPKVGASASEKRKPRHREMKEVVHITELPVIQQELNR